MTQTFVQAIWGSKRSNQCLWKGDLTYKRRNKQQQKNDQEIFDRVVIPVGQILLHHTEKAVQYTLNGDYEAVQDATRTTFTNTLSWLDLTTFQVCRNSPMNLCWNWLRRKGETFERILCDLPRELLACFGRLEDLRGEDQEQVHDSLRWIIIESSGTLYSHQ